jgi:hypothetical protein
MLAGKIGDVELGGWDNRLFIEAVLCIAGAVGPWRDLSLVHGSGNAHTDA